MTLKEQISWCKSQIKAGYHVEVLRSILKRLQASENKEPPHPFHNQAVQAYKDFLSRYKLPPVFDFRQGKSLREILVELERISIDKTPESAYKSFVYILNNWDKTDEFLHKQKTVFAIRKYLLEIIDAIKNGTKKKSGSGIKNAHTATGRNGFGKL